MRREWLLLVLGVTAGCAAETPAPEGKGSTGSSIVAGQASGRTQDSAVLILDTSGGSCTGSLIAPNLVLTARHCVAEPIENSLPGDGCALYGPTAQANTRGVYVGTANTNLGQPNALGTRITVPQTSNMCSFDVALIELDRPLSAPVATLRFGALQPNEQAVTVGYGDDGFGNLPNQRLQRQTTILAVGQTVLPYRTRNGQSLQFQIPAGDIATGESTCYGDSGGPLFDMQGRVVGVTSRGPNQFPQDGQHGDGCLDLPSLYASARMNEATIRQAATLAGHPLPAEGADQGKVASSDDELGSDDGEDFGSDADKTDEDTTKVPKKRKGATVQPTQGSGCAIGPTRSADAPSLVALALAFALSCSRRASRKKRASS